MSQQELTSYRLSSLQEPTDDMLHAIMELGSFFESTNKRVMEDRHFVWQLRKVLRQHRSKEWKKEQLYRLLTEFDGKD